MCVLACVCVGVMWDLLQVVITEGTVLQIEALSDGINNLTVSRTLLNSHPTSQINQVNRKLSGVQL